LCIFRMGKKKSFNPLNFIQSLGLKPQEQQDAQEFNKLLLNLMESALRDSPSSKVRRFIPDMFQGTTSNITRCTVCGRESKRSMKFYELTLQVRGMGTLEDSLKELCKVEMLSGQNQYLCSNCKRKTDAERRTGIDCLPPVLNVQLIRFGYDLLNFRKKKLLDNIGVPVVLDMREFTEDGKDEKDEKLVYDLAAILHHQGTSANVGHYTIDVRNEYEGDWWHFDDKKVKQIGPDICNPIKKSNPGRSKSRKADEKDEDYVPSEVKRKKPKQVHSSSEGKKTHRNSKNAYMLVYIKRAGPKEMRPQPPTSFVKKIEGINKEYLNACEKYDKDLSRLQEHVKGRRELVTKVMEVATAYPSEKEYVVLHREWLENFISGTRNEDDKLAMEIHPPDEKQTELLCIHSKLDPLKRNKMKRIKKHAWNLIGSNLDLKCKDLSVCQECAMKHMGAIIRKKHWEKEFTNLYELLQAKPKPQKGFWISKTWLRHFRSLVQARKKSSSLDEKVKDKDGFVIEIPDDVTKDLTCDHGGLIPGKKNRKLVSTDAWNSLMKKFKGRPYPAIQNDCEICLKAKMDSKISDQGQKRKRRREEKKAQTLVRVGKGKAENPGPFPPKRGVYYLIPHAWVISWLDYVQGGTTKPSKLSSEDLLCQHKKLKFSIYPKHFRSNGTEPGEFVFVKSSEFSALKDIYGASENQVVVTFNSSTQLWESVVYECNPLECKTCINERTMLEKAQKLFYTEGELNIVELDQESPVPNESANISSNTKRKRRRPQRRKLKLSKSSFSIVVDANDTVALLKLKVFEVNEYSPAQQMLYYNRVPLLDDSKTLKDLEIEDGATLYLKVDSKKSADFNFASMLPDEDVMVRQERGFESTLLANF